MTATMKRKALGRGLDALLGNAVATDSDAPHEGITRIPVADIQPGKYQPRRHFDRDELKSLADSIRERGVLQPVLIRPTDAPDADYELIAGERRWQAAQQAGLHEIPAIIRHLPDGEALEIALVENIQRQDLSPMEEAEGLQRLMDEFGHTQDALAGIVGRSRPHVANTLRLLKLPDSVRALVQEGKLSAGHARALLTLRHPEKLALQVVEQNLSVRETEELVRKATDTETRKSGAPAREKDPDTIVLEREIREALGLVAEIRQKKRGGELILKYKSLDQLDEVLQKLMGAKT